jgi:membrane protease YdiL (CAAX protease family)
MVFLSVLGIIFIKIKKGIWTWRDVGFQKKTFNFENLSLYLFVTLIFCIGFIVIHGSHNTKNLRLEIILLSMVYCFCQELVFRGYLMKVGKEWFGSDATNIAVNVILFTLMHSFYKLDATDYTLLAIAGFGFSYMYYKIPNIWLVTIFHFCTNLLALHLGMFGHY